VVSGYALRANPTYAFFLVNECELRCLNFCLK